MRRVLFVSVLLIAAGAAAQTGYINELKGSVTDSNFNFAYSSDWKQHQIVNFVRNDNAQSLVVFWQAGGVTRPAENPLLPHKMDSSSSPCPESRLGNNLNATLTYGLSDHTTTAGVYLVSQPRNTSSSASASTLQFQAQPAQPQQAEEPIPFSLVSDINTDIKGEPVRLQVVSQRIVNEGYIEYFFVFIQGKPTNFALNLHYFTNAETGKPVAQDLMKYFGDAKISVEPDAAQTFKYDKLPLEQVPNFKAFSLIQAPMPKTTVKIPAKNGVQVRRQLLFLLDTDRHILASGYVTLHIPA